ncbi:hypothetical protein [Shinella sp. BYT-45]|uniref:hypothetical protein n=1 Tax=Shinella sp. BYT-45 TaxID=3377377 RepID=UPI0039815019
MAAESAKIVDFQAYRDARRKASAPPPAPQTAMPLAGMQPMMMWVPVWTFFPVVASPWVHAQ